MTEALVKIQKKIRTVTVYEFLGKDYEDLAAAQRALFHLRVEQMADNCVYPLPDLDEMTIDWIFIHLDKLVELREDLVEMRENLG
jgi:hypothetical protein